MREDGDAAGVTHDLDRLLERNRMLPHVRGRVMAEVPLERLVEGLHMSVLHQRLRHVRPADGAAPRDLLHFLHRDPDAESLQARQDLSRPLVARLAIAGDGLEQAGVRRVEAVGEEARPYSLSLTELGPGTIRIVGRAGPLDGHRGPMTES